MEYLNHLKQNFDKGSLFGYVMKCAHFKDIIITHWNILFLLYLLCTESVEISYFPENIYFPLAMAIKWQLSFMEIIRFA